MRARRNPYLKYLATNRPKHPRIQKLNNYLIREKIGTGANCTLYRAMEIAKNRTYAAKWVKLHEIARTENRIAQLERESQLMRLFEHPNILRLSEVLHVRSADEVILILEYAGLSSSTRMGC
jgi:serine/threonine protein kinase